MGIIIIITDDRIQTHEIAHTSICGWDF